MSADEWAFDTLEVLITCYKCSRPVSEFPGIHEDCLTKDGVLPLGVEILGATGSYEQAKHELKRRTR